jgi:hypothetical protein
VPELVFIGQLMPTGMPFSLFDRPQAQRQAYVSSVSLSEVRRNAQRYLLSLHEVFARLMDQALREAAARRGLPLPLAVHRPDDVPLDLFRGELEPRVWEFIERGRGW